jgi:(+)-trans-carveol dehydrogenase
MGRVEGKVALVTGAARGQGRSHAIRLAQEGADIIAVDIQGQIESALPMATTEDMAETIAQVEALGRRIVATKADVRDFGALKAATDDGVAQLGRLDIVSANAGIVSYGGAIDLDESAWRDVIDVNLTGVWHTAKVAVPHIRAGDNGGSIVLTSSGTTIKPGQSLAHYISAKSGVVGLMRALALELAPEMIRVNSIHPGSVNTPLLHNEPTYALFAPDLTPEQRTEEAIGERFQRLNPMPVKWVESIDISNALLFLASDEARYITGVTLPVDAGITFK